MDPRKTVVIADFEEVMRGVKQASELERQPLAAPFGAKTLAWSSEPDARTSSDPAVVVSRTVIASGEPRSLALAKTQVWRSEVSAETETDTGAGLRERTRVHVDESVMQHLSAEVWAGQPVRGARLMMTTVRRSAVDLQVMPVAPRRSEPPIVCEAAIATRPTPISTEVYDPPRIPRHFQLPSAQVVRVAAALVCAASLALLGVSTLGSFGKPGRAAVRADKQPAANPPTSAAASSGPQAASRPTTAVPAPANTVVGTSDTPPAPSVSSASQREAVDALISGKHPLALARYRALARQHPGEPVYAVAAQILLEAQQRNAE